MHQLSVISFSSKIPCMKDIFQSQQIRKNRTWIATSKKEAKSESVAWIWWRTEEQNWWDINMVARCYIFKQKISIWVNFGVPCSVSYSYILRPFGLFYCHLLYFKAIYRVHFVVFWVYLSHFGILYRENSGNPGYQSVFAFQMKKVFFSAPCESANHFQLLKLKTCKIP
jgi:hypothetical protein